MNKNSKFNISKKQQHNKNGSIIETIVIKPNNANHLITYKDVEILYNKMKLKSDEAKDLKIVGENRYRRCWTMKSSGEENFTPEDDYANNKPAYKNINGFFQVVFIKQIPKK